MNESATLAAPAAAPKIGFVSLGGLSRCATRSSARVTAMCLAGVFAAFSWPVAGAEELPAATVVAPIFDELFVHQLPAGFKVQAEQVQGGVYVRTVVLASDPSAGPWTQRVLVSATKDLGLQAGLTPAMFAMQIAKGFQSSCPTSFAGGRVAEANIGTGHAVYVMLVGCGSHTLTTNKAPTSEVALVAVVKGDKNM
jgi:hypothetical protein